MSDLVKIVVFVPPADADKIRQVVGDAGAGMIGKYSHCTYSSIGYGRYKPLEGAHPTIGEVGKFEQVEEERIEMVCKKEIARSVVEKIKAAHPYEEVALDIYPLLDENEL